jgi:hypothetical protein
MPSDDIIDARAESAGQIGYVEIFQDRDWFGDPRLAAFVVYVDGARRGNLALKSMMKIQLPIGPHRIRIRQWYFMSPSLNVNVTTEETIRLKADILRAPLLRGLLRMVFINRALELKPSQA